MKPLRLHAIRLSALFIALFTLSAFAAGNDHYDEVYDKNGNPRPGYREILPEYEKLSKTRKRQLEKLTKKDFQGDNTLDLLPRVITQEDQEVLRKGIAQRGTALRMFLEDYFAGNNRAVYKLIPKDVLERIINRSGDVGFRKLVNPKSIAFPYGPDIIRAPDGSWRVIEDNHGYIGGMGDLIRARESLYQRMPEYEKLIDAENKPERFYDDLVNRFRKMADPKGGKVITYATGAGDDNEDARLKKIFSDRGVDYVSPYTKQQLQVDESGVWVIGENRSRERVGYIFLNTEHTEIDTSNKTNYGRSLADMVKKHLDKSGDKLDEGTRYVLEDAIKINPKTGTYDVDLIETALELTHTPNAVKHKLSKVEAKGLIDAMLDGRVTTSYTPGIEFMGDKEFYVYVEDMVRHYLKEEPILKNIPTQKFADKQGKLDSRLLNKVMQNPEKYVVKAVDGRGGDSVWVGPKISKKEFRSVHEKILKEPHRYIVQEYTPLSLVGDKIADIRGLSLIDSKGAVTADSFFARGLPKDGNGKVNISDKGREMAVLVIDPEKSKSCVQKFSAINRGRR